jgi:hypothetical protein
MDDRTQFHIDTNSAEYAVVATGIARLPLHSDAFEEVSVEKWEAGATVTLDAPDGLEALILDGSFEEAGDTLQVQSWLRLPKGAKAQAKAGPDGAKVWIKRNHLARDPQPPKA